MLLPLLVGCYTPPDLPLVDDVPMVADRQCAPGRVERVACVLDGDTFDMGECGDEYGERVRMLGIDAPEIAHPGNAADCWGPEAQAETTRLLDGREITVTFDKTCLDVYERTLAYVWIAADEVEGAGEDLGAGDVLVNEVLLERGHARLYDKDWVGDLRLQARLDAAEATARSRGAGLWSACGE